MRRPRKIARYLSGLSLATTAGLLTIAALLLEPTALASPPEMAPSWNFTGSLNTARYGHSATLLTNGKVLVAGGGGFFCTGNSCLPGGPNFSSTELYDPATGMWSYTGSLNTARVLHTATLLPNGQVLVAGGR